MKFARFRVDRRTRYAVVENDTLREITGTPFGRYVFTGAVYPLKQVKLLVPVDPSKALGVARNYRSHVYTGVGLATPLPKEPQCFVKAPSSIGGPGDAIIFPPGATRVEAEGELAVVIKRRAKNVPEEHALDYVLGYTCGNDVSAREWQEKDVQWWRAKSSDTFGPIGPYIATDLDPAGLNLRVRINGVEVQKGHTSEMVFDVPTLISHFSRFITFEPGDVIFTGTPGQTSGIRPGDVVEVEIDGIGVLRNQVAMEG